ncbi:hypothetical protein [Lysobacter sp. CA196]|uniref:hypothetical protein n=1 Tax=Lysobacter sp. CA196 TaxID=3455606 RepID=UPI003F8D8186
MYATVSVRIADAPAANPGRAPVSGQANAAAPTPRYDRYLRRVRVGRIFKLHDRNYGYRIVLIGGIVDHELGTAESLIFVSKPSNDAEEFSGVFSGRLEVETNKRNFEFNISRYEQLPEQCYLGISRYQPRATYVGDVSPRQLLQPDRHTLLSFEVGRANSKCPSSAGGRAERAAQSAGNHAALGGGKSIADEGAIACGGATWRCCLAAEAASAMRVAAGRFGCCYGA